MCRRIILKKIFAKLKNENSNLLSKVGLVASGTLFAQIISITVSPIITRLFPADQYGIMSVFISTTSIINIASSLDYNKAIPIINTDEDARAMVQVCITILLCFTGIIALLCLVLPKSLFEFIGIGSIFPYRWTLPLSVVFVGIYNILLQWVYRRRAYIIVTKTKIIQALAGSIIKILAGLLMFGPVGLLVGIIVSEAAGLTTIVKKLKNDTKNNITNPDKVTKKGLLRKYYKFAAFSLPADFIDNFCNQIPVLSLAGFFGTGVSGYYGLANTVIIIPINLIIVSMSKVVYAEAARIGKDNPYEIKKLCLRTTKMVFYIITIPCIIIVIWGPQLFGLVFGQTWLESGEYARLMIGRIIAFSLVLPIGRMLEIFGYQQYDLAINIGRFVLIAVAVFAINILKLNSYNTVLLLSSVNMIAYAVLYGVIMWCIEKHIMLQKTIE